MTIRYVIRPPNILSTPRALKQGLGARRTLSPPFSNGRKPSLSRDFFLFYPQIEDLEEHGTLLRNTHNRSLHQPTEGRSSRLHWQRTLDHYQNIRTFFASNKPQQRATLRDSSFPVPPFAIRRSEFSGMVEMARHLGFPSTKYIVRALRHSGGIGWRITESPTDFTEGEEYIQCVYPKNHEYRIIVCRGVPIITLLKQVPSDLPRSQPWNHANGSSFVTVNDPSNDRLRHTDVYDRIAACELFKHIDLLGIDIMYRRQNEYAVCEVNFCPGIHIQDNLQKVVSHVLQVHS